jgi:hypothetical protein
MRTLMQARNELLADTALACDKAPAPAETTPPQSLLHPARSQNRLAEMQLILARIEGFAETQSS